MVSTLAYLGLAFRSDKYHPTLVCQDALMQYRVFQKVIGRAVDMHVLLEMSDKCVLVALLTKR